MEVSLKLESTPTLWRSAFLPADTTITRKVVATTDVASSVVHRKEYCFGGIENIYPRPPKKKGNTVEDDVVRHKISNEEGNTYSRDIQSSLVPLENLIPAEAGFKFHRKLDIQSLKICQSRFPPLTRHSALEKDTQQDLRNVRGKDYTTRFMLGRKKLCLFFCGNAVGHFINL